MPSSSSLQGANRSDRLQTIRGDGLPVTGSHQETIEVGSIGVGPRKLVFAILT
jgi:hypothetical protein